MCGIAGIVGEANHNILKRLTDALTHRGPDGEGYHIDEQRGVFLGHRRLSIIDIAGGSQPMWDESKSVAIIFNGEIYNHRDLRIQLKARGHKFRSDHSDTEVLVYGHLEWGDELPLKLDGMFSYAILDMRTNMLVLARDRFGEKPLFWASTPHGFAFSSELPSLRLYPPLEGRGLDPLAIRKFLAHGFIPAPSSGIEGIYKLPHGHYLKIDLGERIPRVYQWWRFSIEPAPPPSGNVQNWTEELRERVDRAVASRLESDVPLGIFLSGGIDSSIMLLGAANHVPRGELQCFSIGFDEKSFDETPFARVMAQEVGAKHQVEICKIADQKQRIEPLLARLGEPFGDPSILPTYQLCKFARRSVTVALSGDGGDELFAGYDPFAILNKARLYQKLVPRPVHHAVAYLAGLMPISVNNMSLDFKLRRGLRGLSLPASMWNPAWLGPLACIEIAEVMRTPISEEELYSEAIEAWEGSSATDLVNRSMEFYTNFYMPEGILVKTDRAAMLNGLEVRAPFLANDLVDFVRRLPASVKLHEGQGKWILRQAFREKLPEVILSRPKKGFGIPLAAWLREMPEPECELPLEVLDEVRLSAMWKDHAKGTADWRGALWCWMSLRQTMFGVAT